jgi:hypothetical protein
MRCRLGLQSASTLLSKPAGAWCDEAIVIRLPRPAAKCLALVVNYQIGICYALAELKSLTGLATFSSHRYSSRRHTPSACSFSASSAPTASSDLWMRLLFDCCVRDTDRSHTMVYG